ncbi:MAG: rhomboid family intramembrane serine protease [Bacteroidota bacterium]|nr:rhomboid family intramembrane serine protease [Bacteroidota bacterium]
MGITAELKYAFRQGSMLHRLIYLNLGVFVIVTLVRTGLWLFQIHDLSFVDWFSVPASTSELLMYPWTVLTYMFFHIDFLHILFNLLWLYWFGKIFLEYFDEKMLLVTYLMGGIFGALFFIGAYNVFPAFDSFISFSRLLGASASIIAIVVTLAFFVPNHVIHIVLIGPVRIKYVALISVLLYVIGISSSNPGGNLAHLGGAFWGMIYGLGLRNGKNYGRGVENLLSALKSPFRTKNKLRVSYRSMNNHEYNAMKNEEKKEIDRILDKIGRSGYDSLSKDEKEVLFRAGKKN